ncbi:hypothetical protein CRENBAI_013573, partial [Crenichthys baileyi]
ILPSRGSHGVTCPCLSLNRVLRRVETQNHDAFSDSWSLLTTPKPILSRRTVGLYSEKHSPARPPSIVRLKSQQRFFPRKKGQFFSNWRSQPLAEVFYASDRLLPLCSLRGETQGGCGQVERLCDWLVTMLRSTVITRRAEFAGM